MDKVSVIVCTLNNEKHIKVVLESIIVNKPHEIIVVDANSEDGTAKIATEYCNLLLQDKRKGLAAARNLGLDHATGDYILYVGSDNVLKEDTIKTLLVDLKKNEYACIGAKQVVLSERNNYLKFAMNLQFDLKFKPGLSNVVGTPSLYNKEILAKYRFSQSMSWSDDTELSLRLIDSGHKIGYSSHFVYEIGTNTLLAVTNRWFNYGRSDHEFFRMFEKTWSLRRKIKSLLHPLNELNLLTMINNYLTRIFFFPYLFYIINIRYFGWVFFSIKDNLFRGN